jgi:hypothetical protein
MREKRNALVYVCPVRLNQIQALSSEPARMRPDDTVSYPPRLPAFLASDSAEGARSPFFSMKWIAQEGLNLQ